MSLSQSNHLSVSLTPSAIGVAVYSGHWHTRTHDILEVLVEGEGLDSALAALHRVLETNAKAGSTIRFTISNHYCRVAVLPWMGSGVTSSERNILVQRLFNDLYGDMTGWETRCDCLSAYGEASLAVAMQRSMLASLQNVTRDLKLKCRSISANAVASLNRYRKGLDGAAMFVVAEPGATFVMSMKSAGRGMALQTARIVSSNELATGDSFGTLIERELILQGHAESAPVLCDSLSCSLGDSRSRYRSIPYPADVASPAMAMAANGVA